MLALRHLHKGIGKIRLSSILFGEPHFVETLSADTAAQMGMKLKEQGLKVSQHPCRRQISRVVVSTKHLGLPEMSASRAMNGNRYDPSYSPQSLAMQPNPLQDWPI